jgi:hypothetical protein
MSGFNEKVRRCIHHVRNRTDQLVAEGVDRKSLATRVAALEKALDEKTHASVIGQKLTELKGEFEQAAANPTVRDAIALLNEIFATGVPSP